MRSKLGALVLSLVVFLPMVGCDAMAKKIERRTTLDWVTGQRQVAGACEFQLDHAWLEHAEDWRGGVTMTMRNVGEAPTRCGWDAAIVGASQKVISNHDGKTEELAPGAARQAIATINAKYMADAANHDAWVYIGIFEGTSVSGAVAHNVANPDVRPRADF